MNKRRLISMGRDLLLTSVIGLHTSIKKTEGKDLGKLGFAFVPLLSAMVDAAMDGLTPKAVPPPIANPKRTSRDSSAYPSVKFFVTDHIGNVRVAYCPSINDTTCRVQHEVLAVIDYYPYGKALRSWTTDPQRWQSTGNERDQESGWDFRGARLYDASYGRFLSTDPMAMNFAGWSPYNYVLGNPIGLTDVSGLSPEGGGESGFSAPVGSDGIPHTRLGTVHITAKSTCSYCALNAVIKVYNAPEYFTRDYSKGNGYRSTGNDQWTIEGIQIVLDVVGATEMPVISQLADLASAGISYANGDKVGAVLGVSSMAPVAGSFFAVIKWGRRGVNVVEGAVKISRYADETVAITRLLSKNGDQIGATTVYISRNAEDVIQYVGITDNIVARAAAHMRKKGIGIEELLPGLSRFDARAIEQVIIDHFQLGKNGGSLMNKINSISAKNPIYNDAIKRGKQLLEGAGISF
jgi:RHS repeat-associated protein